MVRFTPDNKAWVKLQSDIVEGFIKTDKLSAILDNAIKSSQPADLTLKVSKIPTELFNKVLGTLQVMNEIEAAFILYYSTEKDEWLIDCPKNQLAGPAHVKYHPDRDREIYLIENGGFYRVGSIHTHPRMRAFWSGTDMRDHEGSPGIHIVLGLTADGMVNSYKTTVFTSYGYRDIPIEAVIESPDFSANLDPHQEYLEVLQDVYNEYKAGTKSEYEILKLDKPEPQLAPVAPAHMPMSMLYSSIYTSNMLRLYMPTKKRYARGTDIAISRLAFKLKHGYAPEVIEEYCLC